MINALVKIDENTNRILNVIKAKYALKDKGEAINFMAVRYAEMEGEPELRADFIEKMKKIEKQKSIKVDNFAKRYGLN